MIENKSLSVDFRVSPEEVGYALAHSFSDCQARALHAFCEEVRLWGSGMYSIQFDSIREKLSREDRLMLLSLCESSVAHHLLDKEG